MLLFQRHALAVFALTLSAAACTVAPTEPTSGAPTDDDGPRMDHWRKLVEHGASFDEVRESLRSPTGVITRFLGGDDCPDVDVTCAPLRNGDLYLIATDGVTRELDDPDIQAIVGEERRSLASRCDALVDAANAKRVADDITAVLVQVAM